MQKISDNTYIIPGLTASPADPATGGYVTFADLDYRLILSQDGDTVTLLLPFNTSQVTVGTSVDVYAGCDHTIAICKTQFDNVINYGGYAFVPLKNPFQSGL